MGDSLCWIRASSLSSALYSRASGVRCASISRSRAWISPAGPSGRERTHPSSKESSTARSCSVLLKTGMSPVKHSPRSWIRHIRTTLSMSSPGNSWVSRKAIRLTRQLCSATLSGLLLEVVQCRKVSFSRSATCRMSRYSLGSICLVRLYVPSRGCFSPIGTNCHPPGTVASLFGSFVSFQEDPPFFSRAFASLFQEHAKIRFSPLKEKLPTPNLLSPHSLSLKCFRCPKIWDVWCIFRPKCCRCPKFRDGGSDRGQRHGLIRRISIEKKRH